jgi:MFS family permease
MNLAQRPVPVEQPPPRRRSGFLAPFRYRDYRLLWSGLIVSNLGTWMQLTTLGYLVVKLAGTARLAALDVGILGASSAIPVLLLSPLAGAVADRFPRRRVLLVTNSIEVCAALTLAVLASTGRIALWEIFIIAGIRSTGQSFDAPARQSWVPLLVPREYLGNAIGLLILYVGLATSFYLNAVLTFATVAAILMMKAPPPSSTVREDMFASIAHGVRFLATNPVLRPVLLMLVATCLLVRPYQQLMPAYAAHVVHVDARGLGFLLAAIGAGADDRRQQRTRDRARRRAVVWISSACVMSLGTITLGSVHSFGVAIVVLVFVGLSVLSFVGSSNVLLQTLSPEDMRGRAISVFSMIILGLIPAGSLLLGTFATFVGIQTSLICGGSLALVLAAVVWFSSPELRAV